jgi:hypothetical protein
MNFPKTRVATRGHHDEVAVAKPEREALAACTGGRAAEHRDV